MIKGVDKEAGSNSIQNVISYRNCAILLKCTCDRSLAEESMTMLIGQDLGGYRIISQVGKGGMATVYKAFQPSLDRYVAVKVMPPFYAQEDETFIKRFKREAQSIAKLRHPNILLVIDFGEQDGLIYIVMEFVDAGTLTDRLGKPLPFQDAAKILDQVASALDYAHTQGLVHRAQAYLLLAAATAARG